MTTTLHLPFAFHRNLTSSWAVFSRDGRYRYLLGRRWDLGLPMLGVVMLNPSTAGANTDDATVRRVKGFARDNGYGGIEVGNLYGLRSRDPKALWSVPDPVGLANDAYLERLSRAYDLILLAWGANARRDRAAHVTQLLRRNCRRHGGALAVLGWTQAGQPRHPLYVAKNAMLECLTLTSDGDLHQDEDPRWSQLMAVAA
ncbi:MULTISPECIES: DUF1643 domain-containing protein [Mycolicibacter]|uniref:DUF1643 domain-containing protein n=2 Tax=Mycolicibacter TaxID=1073531 RepID=A0ABU5XMG4_9MYCO|nr:MULTISPECIES: DUF1643 domain-containing protein [unclassified Mycolicibacter]MEB3023455.1 DUF1643 domain-containing protein [Mycolicibacter sp. MYC098]MEB3033798.1 DUF1643 domain-containing protein [Mycolicibacter sp. MYC340]